MLETLIIQIKTELAVSFSRLGVKDFHSLLTVELKLSLGVGPINSPESNTAAEECEC